MNAFEFVKEKGIEVAKDVVADYPYAPTFYNGSMDDLKRIVDSHELADRLGDVDTMRIMIEQMEINDLCSGMNISFDGKWQGVFTKHRLQQAIADVGQCQ